ncbi:MAG TPA: ubiquinone/menaquinone biosynthesis methyltransferase [Anaerolineae bacterium]|nr:ubiquinone/menaquinone biosynthesis methyltransferase [Anaerolineae bacterium]HPL27131.1 ubiquinone/menaquinone biosynthesis methyltransferase [Anaerolineae bacterium]
MTNPDKAAAVARLFAAIAPRYDLMNRLMTARMDVAWRRRACDLLGRLPEGAMVLDVGTGTADLALTMAQRQPGLRVLGVDLSPEMLALGRQKVARAGLDGRIALVRGDALALPCPEGAGAAVVSAFTLRNVADVPRALGEMRRAVQPGGVVLCLELSQPRLPGFRPLFRLYFTRLVPVLGALVARSRAAYTYLPQSVDAFLSPAGLARAMENAGLDVEHVEPLALGAAAIHVARRMR